MALILLNQALGDAASFVADIPTSSGSVQSVRQTLFPQNNKLCYFFHDVDFDLPFTGRRTGLVFEATISVCLAAVMTRHIGKVTADSTKFNERRMATARKALVNASETTTILL